MSNRLVGIWDYNVDKDILQWDTIMSIIFGRGDEPIVGDISLFTELLHPEDKDRVVAAVMDCIEGRVIQYDSVYRVIKPSGEEELVHAWGSLFDHNGDKCLIGACDEVTDRNYVLQELIKMRNGR